MSGCNGCPMYTECVKDEKEEVKYKTIKIKKLGGNPHYMTIRRSKQ